MKNRRHILKTGLAALGYGLSSSTPSWARPFRGQASDLERPVSDAASPIHSLPDALDSIAINGLPFGRWFSGDDFRGHTAIPFHTAFQGPIPPATEDVEVAVVGGGISGLATAYMLSDHRPVVFDIHPRFGGNAQGETWRDTRYSLGSAYVITPDEGSFLERIYRDLGLEDVKRTSFPPDPTAFGGSIHDDFWSGAGVTAAEKDAFERYARVVRYMAEEEYPEIPLVNIPAEAAAVMALDRKTFREDVEERMGIPLTPLLASGIQSYFYSSFGAGMDEISAAAGWNFVAAEEFGRWVFPGGNSYMAWALWERLRDVEAQGQPGDTMLRPSCTVVDARREGDRYKVTWIDAHGHARALTAKYVVMAGSKHIVKHFLRGLESKDAAKANAMNQVATTAYLVANVLLDEPIALDFYDIFLINDSAFPMTPGAFEAGSRPVDALNANYALPASTPRSVLTLYWPLPWPTARFSILDPNAWRTYCDSVSDDVRAGLALVGIDISKVRQVRLARWGHALPIAKPYFIADGHAAHLRRPFDERVYFANQDNWALPAIENSLLDARWVADQIRARL